MSTPAQNQWLRSYSLVVSTAVNGTVTGKDLSALRFKFEIRGSDLDTPNTAVIRVYNLADSTIESIREFGQVSLQAGYVNGNVGTIFSGDIKQFRRGKENNVDTYLDILAADGDQAYNFGIVNTTLAPGSNLTQRLNALADAMGVVLDKNAPDIVANSTGGIIPLPRSKVMYGMARTHLRNIANSTSTRWSIQNGVLTFVPLAGYLPGEAVVINSVTGMIGQPEATDQGIMVKTLLNPLIKIGTRVQINNKDINQTIKINGTGQFGYQDTQYLPARTTDDGFYRVMVAEHFGDTRGNEWYTELVCLNVDVTNNSVLPYG